MVAANEPPPRGWFFYEEQVATADPETGVEASDSAVPDSAWLRDNMESIRLNALDNPTPANVQLYLELQKLAIMRAEGFAETAKDLVVANPALSALPGATSSFAHSVRNELETQWKETALASLSRRAGLYYFYSSDCPYCLRQEPVLEQLQSRHSMSVLRISLDGGPPPGAEHAPYVVDSGQSQVLDVTVTPTLYIVGLDGEPHHLATGLTPFTELTTRITQTAEKRGWITRPAVLTNPTAPTLTEASQQTLTNWKRQHHANSPDTPPDGGTVRADGAGTN